MHPFNICIVSMDVPNDASFSQLDMFRLRPGQELYRRQDSGPSTTPMTARSISKCMSLQNALIDAPRTGAHFHTDSKSRPELQISMAKFASQYPRTCIEESITGTIFAVFFCFVFDYPCYDRRHAPVMLSASPRGSTRTEKCWNIENPRLSMRVLRYLTTYRTGLRSVRSIVSRHCITLSDRTQSRHVLPPDGTRECSYRVVKVCDLIPYCYIFEY